MKTTQIALVLALLAPAAVACSGAGTNVTTATAQEAATKAPLGVQVQGPLSTIADAFAEVPLRPAQRTEIASLVSAANDRHVKAQPAHKDVMLALADQVEKGNIDEAALQTKIDAAKAQMTSVAAEDRKAVQRVHDMLDADQRTALVDALEAKRHERFGSHEGQHEGRMGHMGGFGMMGKELNLSADQKAKIHEAMQADMKSYKAQGDVKHERGQHANPFDAFKADTFDVEKAFPAHEGDRMMGGAIHFAKVAVPILTHEQRTTAAKILRDRADMKH